MRPKIALCLILAVSLGTTAFARPAAAEDTSPMTSIGTSGGKLLLEKGAQWAASYIYNNDCKGAAHDVASLVCGALGKFSGDKDAEWRTNVTSQLGAIRGDLDQLKKGQVEMQKQLERLVDQNKVLLATVDTIVDQTVANLDIRAIQTLWSMQFDPLFPTADQLERGQFGSFKQDQLLRFARAVVREEKVHINLGKLTETLTSRGIGGKSPLLQSYAKLLDAELGTNKGASLLPAYEYFEGVMADLLFEQRKGFLMYVWAAEILESWCQLEKCESLDKPPIRAADFSGTFARQVARQFDAFNSSFEWLVLARSDPRGLRANFLHPDAVEVFYRADLLAAANADSYGLWGRVVSMGDRWDGKLDVSGRTLAPAGKADVPAEGGPFDWWRASGTPLVYDELYFAPSWRVFRYHQADWKAGGYEIRTTLPFKSPLGVNVTPVNLAEDGSNKFVVPFGSFVAIERAGGGYALLSGTWQAYTPRDTYSTGLLRPSHNRLVADAKKWQVGVESRGELPWDDRSRGQQQHGEWERVASLTSDKQIRYPAGGNVTLNALFDRHDFTEEPGKSAIYGKDYATQYSVIGMKTDYESGGISPKPAELKAKVAIVFGDRESINGLVYQETKSFNSPGNWNLDRPLRTTGSAAARLESGKGYPLTIVAWTRVYQEPKGLDATHYQLLARVGLESLYLTPAK